MSSMTLPAQNGYGSQDTQNWLQSTVQTFFATCNWDNQSIEVQAIKFSSITEVATELTFHLSVEQFFAAVNWDGTSLNARSIPEAPLLNSSEPKETFTLTDFSDLF